MVKGVELVFPICNRNLADSAKVARSSCCHRLIVFSKRSRSFSRQVLLAGRLTVCRVIYRNIAVISCHSTACRINSIPRSMYDRHINFIASMLIAFAVLY
jgi:hypothetical protein